MYLLHVRFDFVDIPWQVHGCTCISTFWLILTLAVYRRALANPGNNFVQFNFCCSDHGNIVLLIYLHIPWDNYKLFLWKTHVHVHVSAQHKWRVTRTLFGEILKVIFDVDVSSNWKWHPSLRPFPLYVRITSRYCSTACRHACFEFPFLIGRAGTLLPWEQLLHRDLSRWITATVYMYVWIGFSNKG